MAKSHLVVEETIVKKIYLICSQKVTENSDDIQIVFAALKELLNPPKTSRKRIGFKQDDL